MKEVYQYKSITAEVKDIDEKQGIVTGYFSVFGNIDSDKDMIMPGAYTKTLAENSRRIKHLWQHSAIHPLSRPEVLKEDSHGLYFESKISKTSYGKDVLQLYIDGVVDEHSVGFRTERKNKREDYTELVELKLWEGSTVTWGANEMARSTGFKSMTVEDAVGKMDNVLKAMRHGKYENEEVFESLELYFKQLQQFIIDLSKSTQAATIVAPAPEAKANKELTDDLTIINQLFKSKSQWQTNLKMPAS